MARPNLSERTRKRIVATALEMIDRDGLERLSTRRLAQALDITGPTLYHYFSNKDELIEAIADHISVEIWASVRDRLANAEGGAWQDELRAYALGAYAALRAHPHAIEFFVLRPISNRTTLTGYDDMLTRLVAHGFPLRLAWQTLLATENLVISGALEASAAAFAPPAELHEGLPQVEAVVALLATEPELDEAFVFGLDTLIAGLEARLR